MIRQIVMLSACLAVVSALAGDKPADESTIKEKVQNATADYVCNSEPFLEFTGFDRQSCRVQINEHGAACWQEMDEARISYDFDNSEESFTNLSAVTNLFVYCTQAKLFVSVSDTVYVLKRHQQQKAHEDEKNAGLSEH